MSYIMRLIVKAKINYKNRVEFLIKSFYVSRCFFKSY